MTHRVEIFITMNDDSCERVSTMHYGLETSNQDIQVDIRHELERIQDELLIVQKFDIFTHAKKIEIVQTTTISM